MDPERGSEDVARPAKRPRALVACQRCKSRRQKCDNATPACSNCARAGLNSCIYGENAYPSTYVKTLEERVRYLENALKSREPGQSGGQQQNNDNHQWTARSQDPKLAQGLGVLSSCTVAEPHYFGTSAGLSLAHFVQVAIDASNHSSDLSLPMLADRPFSDQAPQADIPPASLPSFGEGATFIDAYMLLIYPLYPFLVPQQLWRIHERLSRPSAHFEAGDLDQADIVILLLVYAIGSRCLQLVGRFEFESGKSQGLLVRAMETLSDALKFTSSKSVAIVLLLAIHSMRSPSGTSIWHLSGLAIRQCLELGLHRPRKTNDQDSENEQHRIRLFWSVYIFERKTALVLGRPFALNDDEIELDLPANVCVNLSMPDDVDEPTSDEVSHRTTLSFHRFHVQLYQIHGQIRRVLHNVRTSMPNQSFHEVESLLMTLDTWRHKMLKTYSTEAWCVPDRSRYQRDFTEWHASGHQETTLFTGYQTTHPSSQRSIDVERSELLLEHHKAKRTLLQALMIEGRGHFPFSKLHFLACANASGQICQLYRRLHRLRSTPYTLRDLHAVFVAGFTLVYCMFSCPGVPPAESASDLGACSTVLYVITEQWPGARRYRDAFEMVTEKLREYTANTQVNHHPSASAGANDASIVRSSPVANATLTVSDWCHTESSTQLPFSSTPQTNPSVFEADGLLYPTAGPDLLELDTDDFQKLLDDVGLDWFNDVPNNLGAQ